MKSDKNVSCSRLRRLVLSAFSGLGLALLCPSLICSQEQPVLTICELFENLDAYAGKIVKIQGQVLTSRHSFALGQKDCSRPFSTGGAKWPTALNLVRAGSRTLESPVAFSLNQESVERMDKILCFLHSTSASQLGVEITATFVGELQTRNYLLVNRPRANGAIRGFGDGGSFPAQLVYKSVGNIVVRQTP